MRWTTDAPSTETLLAETAAALAAQQSMLRDHGVVLAIETHFEFTSFELVRLFERCEAEPGDWLGGKSFIVIRKSWQRGAAKEVGKRRRVSSHHFSAFL